ncbi:MAG: glycosyltransferase [Muribaculaceae bacterium]|nr:glycosyltransferase [Muribaculaceae bacterium]
MKISIITTTYNSGATLRDTIESVLAQSYADWQHVIVDGGSKDNTVDIIKEYTPQYEGRLKWKSERDKGLYDAMNKGIAMADGDIIGILNSDDFYSSNEVLSRVSIELSSLDVDAVYGDIHFVNDDDLDKNVRYYSSKFFRRWMMRMGYQPAHPSFYCKKDIYDKYGAFDTDFKVAADFENMLRFIFINRIKTRYLNLDFVTMRTGGASTNGWQSHRRIISDHHKAFKKHGMVSGYLMDFLRYPFKIIELLKAKMFPQRSPEIRSKTE